MSEKATAGTTATKVTTKTVSTGSSISTWVWVLIILFVVAVFVGIIVGIYWFYIRNNTTGCTVNVAGGPNTDRLVSNGNNQLKQGEFLVDSAGNKFTLKIDGHLELTDPKNVVLYNIAPTNNIAGPYVAILQPDRNFVVYGEGTGSGGKVAWSSGTYVANSNGKVYLLLLQPLTSPTVSLLDPVWKIPLTT